MPARTVEIELRPIEETSADSKHVSFHQSPSDVVSPRDRLKNSQQAIITPRTSVLRVMAVVTFYIFASISMIMINKLVLRQTRLPILFLWGQLLLAVVILRIASLFRWLALPSTSWPILKSIVPLVTINVVGLVLNTLCLHNIDAVLYQVARSLILPITVALSPLMGQRINLSTVICCIVISIGFIIGVFGEQMGAARISTYGVVFGVLSSFTTALHSFVIKNSFSNVKHSGAFDLVYLNNLFSALFLAPLLICEAEAAREFVRIGGWPALQTFLLGTVLAGAAGLLINLAGFLQIKITSPVTHTVSSAARGVLQTLAAHLFLGEVVTMTRCIGIVVTLMGSCAYSLVKSREASIAEYSKIETQDNATSTPR